MTDQVGLCAAAALHRNRSVSAMRYCCCGVSDCYWRSVFFGGSCFCQCCYCTRCCCCCLYCILVLLHATDTLEYRLLVSATTCGCLLLDDFCLRCRSDDVLLLTLLAWIYGEVVVFTALSWLLFMFKRRQTRAQRRRCLPLRGCRGVWFLHFDLRDKRWSIYPAGDIHSTCLAAVMVLFQSSATSIRTGLANS